MSSIPSISLCVSVFVGLSIWKVYCGKTADWIRMPFGMVSGVRRGMAVLYGVVIVEGEGAVLGFFAPLVSIPFSGFTLLVGRQEGHPACKKLSGGMLVW